MNTMCFPLVFEKANARGRRIKQKEQINRGEKNKKATKTDVFCVENTLKKCRRTAVKEVVHTLTCVSWVSRVENGRTFVERVRGVFAK